MSIVDLNNRTTFSCRLLQDDFFVENGLRTNRMSWNVHRRRADTIEYNIIDVQNGAGRVHKSSVNSVICFSVFDFRTFRYRFKLSLDNLLHVSFCRPF